MSNGMIAALMFASMMVLLVTGQRIFAIVGAVATVFALSLWGTGGYEIPFHAAVTLFNWYPLLTLPLFVFMGYMLSESGIANDLYDVFHVGMGMIPGSLAVGTVILMVAVAAMNGLSVAGMSIGASIALPELLKRGYDKRMVTGVIQGGSSLGIMIPPSVVLVLYGVIAHQSVGALWLAGVFPGLLLALLFMLYIIIRCKLQPELAPAPAREKHERLSWRERFRLFRAGLVPVVIIFSVTGLFFMGIAGLVESAALGALASLLAAIVRRRLTRKVLEETVRKTLSISCMFMWIILAALAFGAVFDGLGAGDAMQTLFITDWNLSPWVVLIMMQLSFLVLGTFLDDTAMLLIVAPLYVPLIEKLGFDPVWFGVLYTVTCQIAYMTPPFGYNLFLMRAMAPPEISLMDIYRSIVPFVAMMLIGLALLMIFPQIALWLPNLYYGK